MNQARSAARSLTPAAALLGALAIVEVLALAPRPAWTSPRLWLLQLGGGGGALLLAGRLGWVGAGAARLVARIEVAASDLALSLASAASLTAHSWQSVGVRV